jgi:acyl-coenzyme A thioesterase PaaI-like protein
MPQPWEDDRMCFACGEKNPRGLHLQFSPLPPDGLTSEFTPDKTYQGYRNVVHGGFIGLLLDEVMVNLPWQREKSPVVSAEVTFRLLRPAPVGETLIISAFFDGEPQRRLIPVRGEVRLKKDGTLIASGRAKCVKVKLD